MTPTKRRPLLDISTRDLNNELCLRTFKPQQLPKAIAQPDITELRALLETTKEQLFERGDTDATAGQIAMLVCVALYGEDDGVWLAQRLR